MVIPDVGLERRTLCFGSNYLLWTPSGEYVRLLLMLEPAFAGLGLRALKRQPDSSGDR